MYKAGDEKRLLGARPQERRVSK